MAQTGELVGAGDLGKALMDYARVMGQQEMQDKQQRALIETQRHHAVTEAETAKLHRLAEENKQKDFAIKEAEAQRKARDDAKEQARRGQRIDLLTEGDMQTLKETEPEIFQKRILPMFEKMGLRYITDPATNEPVLPITRGEWEDQLKAWGSDPTNMQYAMDINLDVNKSKALKLSQEIMKLEDTMAKQAATGAQPTPQQVEQRDALARQYEAITRNLSTIQGQKQSLGENVAIENLKKEQEIKQIQSLSGYTPAEKEQVATVIRAGGSTKDALTDIHRQRSEASRAQKEARLESKETPVPQLPFLSRGYDGEVHPAGEPNVKVSAKAVNELLSLKKEMERGMTTKFSIRSENALRAINSLTEGAVVNGKPVLSVFDDLSKMRVLAFAPDKAKDVQKLESILKKGESLITEDSKLKFWNNIELFAKDQISSPEVAGFMSKLTATAESLGQFYSGGGSATSDFKIKLALKLLDAGRSQAAFDATLHAHANSMRVQKAQIESGRGDVRSLYNTTVNMIMDGERVKAGEPPQGAEMLAPTAEVQKHPATAPVTKKTKSGKTFTIER